MNLLQMICFFLAVFGLLIMCFIVRELYVKIDKLNENLHNYKKYSKTLERDIQDKEKKIDKLYIELIKAKEYIQQAENISSIIKKKDKECEQAKKLGKMTVAHELAREILIYGDMFLECKSIANHLME